MLLKKKTLTHDIQDVEKTNALLIKSKIDRESIKGYTSSELAALLGVKKIIKGKISRKEQSAVESLFVAHSASVDISIYGDDDKLIWKFNDDKYSNNSSAHAVEKAMQKVVKDIPL